MHSVVECTTGLHKAVFPEVSRERIKKYHWFSRYANADGREKVEQVNFCENPRSRFVRVRTYNVRKYFEKKNVAVEIGNVKSTHAIARINFILRTFSFFYVR